MYKFDSEPRRLRERTKKAAQKAFGSSQILLRRLPGSRSMFLYVWKTWTQNGGLQFSSKICWTGFSKTSWNGLQARKLEKGRVQKGIQFGIRFGICHGRILSSKTLFFRSCQKHFFTVFNLEMVLGLLGGPFWPPEWYHFGCQEPNKFVQRAARRHFGRVQEGREGQQKSVQKWATTINSPKSGELKQKGAPWLT